MIFTSNKFEDAMKAFLAYADTLMPIAIKRDLDKQRNEYEEKLESLTRAAAGDRDAAMQRLGVFVPNKDKAEERAKTSISIGIGSRIRGAIACYKADNEVECARLLVLAQAIMFDIIGMPKGSHTLDDAADFMYREQKQRQSA